MNSINGMGNLIYFENNRSTVPAPEVTEAMKACSRKNGEWKDHYSDALKEVAALINAKPSEIAFTVGTSESIALGIELLFTNNLTKGRGIITAPTEHPAVLNACKKLEDSGAHISYIGVDREGMMDVSELSGLMNNETNLVCLMAANNETGVLWPVERIAEMCRENRALFFCDASQFVGKERCDTNELGIDCLAFGSHKIYGPKGIGALYLSGKAYENNSRLRRDFEKISDSFNGSAELCAGFGMAARIALRDHWENATHVSKLRNYFEHQLLDIEGLRINGSTRHRIGNTSNLTFPQPQKIIALKSRCEFLSNANRFSHVLQAMGISEEDSRASFRFSFGNYNTIEEVKSIVEDILRIENETD